MAETDELFDERPPEVQYNEDNIRHMDDMEHIRNRPGMYIGKLGDGSQADDGIYANLHSAVLQGNGRPGEKQPHHAGLGPTPRSCKVGHLTPFWL